MSLQFTPVAPPADPVPQKIAVKAQETSGDFASLLEPSAAARDTTDPSKAADTVDPELKEIAREFLDALNALQAALDAGETPDQDLVDQLTATADALGAALQDGGQPAGMLQSIGAIAGFAAAVLAPGLAPAVAAAAPLLDAAAGGAPPAPPELGALADKLRMLADRLPAADAELGAKLAALADQMSSGKVSQASIDQLGLDPALILSKPASAAAKTEAPAASAAGPQLAAPTAPSDADTTNSAALEKPVGGALASPPSPSGGTDAPEIPAIKAVADAAAKPADTPQAALPTGPQQPAPAAIASKLLPAAYSTPQVNLPQLAFEIARQFQQGNSRFEIRLDPPELGRIDVRMHLDSAGNVTARLTVERSETLDMFQRDQRGLERALQQAGLEGGKTNLEFSLRQGPFERHTGGSMPQFGPSPLLAEAEPAPAPITLYRGTASAGGVNIFV